MRARGKGSSPGRVEGSSCAMLATARPSCYTTVKSLQKPGPTLQYRNFDSVDLWIQKYMYTDRLKYMPLKYEKLATKYIRGYTDIFRVWTSGLAGTTMWPLAGIPRRRHQHRHGYRREDPRRHVRHARFPEVIGPILWGHSGPLCHALSLLSLSSSSWTSMRACDSSDTS